MLVGLPIPWGLVPGRPHKLSDEGAKVLDCVLRKVILCPLKVSLTPEFLDQIRPEGVEPGTRMPDDGKGVVALTLPCIVRKVDQFVMPCAREQLNT